MFSISKNSSTTLAGVSFNEGNGELLNCNAELEQRQIQNKSETLYVEHFYFANTYELIDKKIFVLEN